jgi:DNA invertase Pin-like site-specific DNA recombinase
MLNEVRDDEIRRLRLDGGVAVDEIARRFRLSRRTVFRVLQRGTRPVEMTRNGARP